MKHHSIALFPQYYLTVVIPLAFEHVYKVILYRPFRYSKIHSTLDSSISTCAFDPNHDGDSRVDAECTGRLHKVGQHSPTFAVAAGRSDFPAHSANSRKTAEDCPPRVYRPSVSGYVLSANRIGVIYVHVLLNIYCRSIGASIPSAVLAEDLTPYGDIRQWGPLKFGFN